MLATGSRLGPYELLGPLGAGGMGEVYRAKDLKLGREVAIKILPEVFADDPDRLARFQREAQVLASLNHPNIAAIYGLEESEATKALVLELVPGETLADRIARGPIPLDEALPITNQIAEALEAAHEQGIVHRDLKPANIKITPDGVVKVLDFGLAKLAQPPAAGGMSPLSMSPTITSPAMMTGVGVLLGTAPYMSPEQAKGREADKRSDVWGFGCVLYEMLTGKRAFDGEDVSDTLASVLKGEPEWQSLPPSTPPSVRRLLRRALSKDRRRRLADVADARADLHDAEEELREPPDIGLSQFSTRRRWRDRVVVAFALVFIASTIGIIVWQAGRPTVEPPLVRFEVLPPEGPPGIPRLDLSPDGRRLAFLWPVGGRLGIWMRSLSASVAQLVRGTEGLRQSFFWSSDSRSLAFVRNGQLMVVSADGGPARMLAALPDATVTSATGTWGTTGVILIASAQVGGGLLRVPAAGGSPTRATELDASKNERLHAVPHFLPDGRHYFFLAVTVDGRSNAAYVGALDSPVRVALPGVASEVRYSPTGHILFLRDGALMAQRCDADRLRRPGQAAGDRGGPHPGRITTTVVV